ncbi:MAG TPA: hypothetical protein VFD67_10265 [Gemmatimonadaceae bacterium]|nr:hypothetical protein [Gemmatimonadaceae bacterium]
MRRHRRVGILLGAMLIGCTDPTKHPAGCRGNVDLNVGLLEEGPFIGYPVFAWSPACGITSLTVETVPAAGGAGVLVWQVSAPEGAQVGPAIVYSRRPRGATEVHQADQLHIGVDYRVTVTSTVGGDASAGGGTITFHL